MIMPMTNMLKAARNGVALQIGSVGAFLKLTRKIWAIFLKRRVIWNLIFGIWLTRGKGHEGEDLLCGRRW